MKDLLENYWYVKREIDKELGYKIALTLLLARDRLSKVSVVTGPGKCFMIAPFAFKDREFIVFLI